MRNIETQIDQTEQKRKDDISKANIAGISLYDNLKISKNYKLFYLRQN